MKIIGLLQAKLSGKDEQIREAVAHFISAERNQLLNKGETTTEIELEKASQANNKFSSEQITEILKALANVKNGKS